MSCDISLFGNPAFRSHREAIVSSGAVPHWSLPPKDDRRIEPERFVEPTCE